MGSNFAPFCFIPLSSNKQYPINRGCNMEVQDFKQDFVDLQDHIDPVIKKLRDSYTSARLSPLHTVLLLGPFKEFKTVLGLLKDRKFELLPLMITGPTAGVIAYYGWDSQYMIKQVGEERANLYLILGVVVMWYILTLVIHFFRMADVSGSHFHIGAYKILRKAEYQAFLPFIHEGRKFTFEAMRSWFYANQGGYAELYKKQEEWHAKEHEYQQASTQLRKLLQMTIAEKNSLIDEKNRHVLYLTELLEKVKTNAERLVNGRLDTRDLGLFCPYTLYELCDDRLKIIDDVGTSANAKSDIILDDHPEYVSVQVLTHPDPYKYQRVGRNRTIMSFRMVMPNQKIWVMNFHIRENDEKLIELFFGDAIIEIHDLLGLIKVYCYLLQVFVLNSGEQRIIPDTSATREAF